MCRWKYKFHFLGNFCLFSFSLEIASRHITVSFYVRRSSHNQILPIPVQTKRNSHSVDGLLVSSMQWWRERWPRTSMESLYEIRHPIRKIVLKDYYRLDGGSRWWVEVHPLKQFLGWLHNTTTLVAYSLFINKYGRVYASHHIDLPKKLTYKGIYHNTVILFLGFISAPYVMKHYHIWQ